MRKLLLTALLLPLLVRPARQPSSHTVPEPPPAGFPLHAERAWPAGPPRPSVLIVPLDVEAEGFRMTAPEQGVRLDIDADGTRERVAWPEAGARVAFLALDRDGDGRVTSGRELIGSASEPGARSACDALLRIFERSESMRAGSIHAGHALYEQLLLWTDSNHDGSSDAGELTRAREQFTAIGLGYSAGDWADAHGNRIRWEGWLHARTGGPDQHDAVTPADEQLRRRRSFEVILATRPDRE